VNRRIGIFPEHLKLGRTTMARIDGASQHARTGGVRTISLLFGLALLGLVVAGCGGGSAELPTRAPSEVAPPEVVHGEELAGQSCSACHGGDFKGVSGLGTSLRDNTFIQDQTDDGLVAFIKEGRANDAPDNESGVAMPPYGGNTRLTDEDLSDIVAFLRTLQ
jgi:mono/diheme cytochrome c family protein